MGTGNENLSMLRRLHVNNIVLTQKPAITYYCLLQLSLATSELMQTLCPSTSNKKDALVLDFIACLNILKPPADLTGIGRPVQLFLQTNQ